MYVLYVFISSCFKIYQSSSLPFSQASIPLYERNIYNHDTFDFISILVTNFGHEIMWLQNKWNWDYFEKNCLNMLLHGQKSIGNILQK